LQEIIKLDCGINENGLIAWQLSRVNIIMVNKSPIDTEMF